MSISAYLYDAKGRDQPVELSVDTLKQIGADRLLWIDVDSRDPIELRQVAEAIGLSDEALVSLTEPDGARLHNYGTYIQLAVETAPAIVDIDSLAKQSGGSFSKPHIRLDFVINTDWLLTVHDGEIEFIRLRETSKC